MFELMLLLGKHFEDKQKWWWEFKMCDIFNNSQSRVGKVWSAKFAVKLSAQDKRLRSMNWCDHEPCIMLELFVITVCPFDFLLFKASASTQRVNEFETETEVNHIPLQALDNLDMWVNVIEIYFLNFFVRDNLTLNLLFYGLLLHWKSPLYLEVLFFRLSKSNSKS